MGPFLGMVYAVTGAYVGAVLFFVTIGIIQSFVDPQNATTLWIGESVRFLFIISFWGVVILSWWIVPVGIYFGDHFDPKLAQWTRKEAVIRGTLLGAALGLITAMLYGFASGMTVRSIQVSFVFLPVYCAAWCGTYSWLKAKRV